ncbi:hypothetical protein VKT23_019860 [Stygiomarasmius scandens]|uniref:Uncharacterized protein n=1 Tax=Marasmiellus scandens TaxID=2682957 RepID=A0ABR1IKA0_9AGAR
MVFFLSTAVSLALAFCLITARAAPLETRQIGGIDCNIARFQIITDVVQTSSLLGKIDVSDPTTADAVSTAQSGVDSASDGIKTILGALFSGQAAPASARDQVGTGLNDALTAMTGLNSTDSAVSDTISKIEEALAAGDKVVETCK